MTLSVERRLWKRMTLIWANTFFHDQNYGYVGVVIAICNPQATVRMRRAYFMSYKSEIQRQQLMGVRSSNTGRLARKWLLRANDFVTMGSVDIPQLMQVFTGC